MLIPYFSRSRRYPAHSPTLPILIQTKLLLKRCSQSDIVYEEIIERTCQAVQKP
jgi:hypothetical protein